VKCVIGFRVRLQNPKSEFQNLNPDFPIERNPEVKKIIGCAWSFILLEVIKKKLLVMKYFLAYLGSSEKRLPLFPKRSAKMINGSEKRKRQLASVLQNSRVFEKCCNQNIDSNLGLLSS